MLTNFLVKTGSVFICKPPAELMHERQEIENDTHRQIIIEDELMSIDYSNRLVAVPWDDMIPSMQYVQRKSALTILGLIEFDDKEFFGPKNLVKIKWVGKGHTPNP